tara:strand:- start:858 stop:1013 length:156 start_codon:yes stop_codon:yes gene_type:complete
MEWLAQIQQDFLLQLLEVDQEEVMLTHHPLGMGEVVVEEMEVLELNPEGQE